MTIRAHFDGHTIVPDEPVSLPVGAPLTIVISTNGASSDGNVDTRTIEERLAAHARFSGSVSGPSLPEDAFDRESIYDDRA